MLVSRDEHLTRMFVMREPHLRALYGALTRLIGPTRLEAKCTDGLFRKFDSLDDFLAYDNSPGRDVKELWLYAFGERAFTQRAALKFEAGFVSNVYISYEAPDPAARELYDVVESNARGMRPWYAPIARTSWLTLFSVVYIPFLAGMVLTGSWNEVLPVRRGGHIAAVLVGLVPAMLAFLTRPLRRRYFPGGEFLFGLAAQRYHDKDLIRTTVILGLIVSIVASVLVAPLTGLFSHGQAAP
jgi:hypothetical protein